MDGLPEHLIAGVPNGPESNYESSLWVTYQPLDSHIPLPHFTTHHYFPATSWPMAPSGLLDPQLMPSQSLHTTPSAPTPRKILTDEVRRQICLYQEENKSAKQVEIADLFGVERSTVSKILRQKEKYLSMPDGTQSPIKRGKHKESKIEKALANWVQKSKRQGRVLTRNDIEEKAKLFAKNCATQDQKLKILTEGWLDKFFNENPIICSSLENSADTVVSDGESTPPILPTGPPLCLSPSLRQGMKNEIGDSAFNISGDFAKHDHSSTLDPIPSPSAGRTSAASPLVSESPYVPTAHSRHSLISSATGGLLNQTFGGEIYSSTYSKHSTNGPFSDTVLNSPLDEKLEEGNLTDTCDVSSKGSVRYHESNADLSSIGNTMQPPHLPPITKDEARHALDLVINYVKSEPGSELPDQVSITLDELKERLNVVRNDWSSSGSHVDKDKDTDSLRLTERRKFHSLT
ncbi:hypothetical protein UA08_09445 [Talaromyces atroroseus]|uniref:HTH CENPB-type domain-containing protein n=1 Tax=Talaromyces atroroseus TaxID=1441469 RepID=A0A225ALK1_TALAT|nr:hypothetical protein UA08_09445 [Talaromyces atroroseus]OKL55295.1 hypothetical protein UA08_09445 [Talaromyces atroroseus]